MHTIRAYVRSGKNLCEKIVTNHSEELKQLTNLNMFPGSLNVILEEPIRFKNAIKWSPWREDWQAFDPKDLIPAMLYDRPIFLQRNTKTRLNETSILAEISLRNTYDLKDGDEIEIKIDEKYIEKLSKLKYLYFNFKYFVYEYIYKKYLYSVIPLRMKIFIKKLIDNKSSGDMSRC